MKKRFFAIVCCLSLLLLIATGCSVSYEDNSVKSGESASKTSGEVNADSSKTLQKVVLNEVAHSIFYAPMYVAIEEGYFTEEGIDLELVTGFGADKVMTALISGEAQIGFMGSESSIYAYNEGANDYVVNFAQLTQRAGNFLVAREDMTDFKWEDLKGTDVLGGRKGVVHKSM